MADIPDSLRLLFETSIESDGDRYVVPVPSELVEGGSLSADEPYRVALLPAPEAAETASETTSEPIPRSTETDTSRSARTTTDTSSKGTKQHVQGPPVEEGEIRTVSIDTLGDQGDGIAKVERGFIVIVPGTKPGDRVEVEITDVKENVAFAETVGEATVR